MGTFTVFSKVTHKTCTPLGQKSHFPVGKSSSGTATNACTQLNGFSPVCIQSFIYFQTFCMAKGLVTLLALKRLLTSVYFFMYFQISCTAECLFTMLALKWLLTTVYFFMYFQILLHCLQLMASHHCVLSCVFRIPAKLTALLHCLNLNGFSPVCFLSCNIRLPV